jgi:hypothetical protein
MTVILGIFAPKLDNGALPSKGGIEIDAFRFVKPGSKWLVDKFE